MAKTKTLYECQQCGAQFPKWAGQCGDCGAWNSLAEEQFTPTNKKTTGYAGERSRVIALDAVQAEPDTRFSTGIKELDHALGGGLVEGSVTLIGGDPGIGKSTLLIQAMTSLSGQFPCLYVTGEESVQQVSMRASRLGLEGKDLQLLAETQLERIISLAEQTKPKVLVIDSIQTVFCESIGSAPGSVSQVRECAGQLVRYAKQAKVALFLVGHVTKEGALAGPRVLEHMVDTVLYFEGQSDARFRVVRAVKNRFGAVNELGVFAMTEKGLKEVSNPSAIFLSGLNDQTPGSVVMITWEGTRPLLIEIQALVDESHIGNPKRVTVGLEQNRLAMLLAVMHRHGGIATFDQDVFINAVGGVRVTETASDLALIIAAYSSLKNQALPTGLAVFGEVGLAGELRPVPNGQERIREATKHGFEKLIVPQANLRGRQPPKGVEVVGAKDVREALEFLSL